MLRVWVSAGALLLGSSCSGGKLETGMEAAGDLAPGVVASVTGSSITEDVAIRIAQARRVPVPRAVEIAVEDALLAAHAEDHRTLAERSALARAMLEGFRKEAESVGPPAPNEIEIARERRWWELDRPEMRRSVHVVVVLEEGTDRQAAHEHAKKIYAAVEHAPNGIVFRENANAIDKQGFRVELQDLLPVAADGRAMEVERYQPPGSRHQSYHVEFAQALFALDRIDTVTPLFESPSGFHVAMLLQIIPEHRLEEAELRATLTEDIYDGRTRGLIQRFLADAKKRTPPDVALDAVNLMGLTLQRSAPPAAGHEVR